MVVVVEKEKEKEEVVVVEKEVVVVVEKEKEKEEDEGDLARLIQQIPIVIHKILSLVRLKILKVTEDLEVSLGCLVVDLEDMNKCEDTR